MIKYMKFLHPALHSGENTTFRSDKWYHATAGDKLYLLDMEGFLLNKAVVVKNQRLQIYYITADMLNKSGCLLKQKTTYGLRQTLCEVYKRDFALDDKIFCITFFIAD